MSENEVPEGKIETADEQPQDTPSPEAEQKEGPVPDGFVYESTVGALKDEDVDKIEKQIAEYCLEQIPLNLAHLKVNIAKMKLHRRKLYDLEAALMLPHEKLVASADLKNERARETELKDLRQRDSNINLIHSDILALEAHIEVNQAFAEAMENKFKLFVRP